MYIRNPLRGIYNLKFWTKLLQSEAGGREKRERDVQKLRWCVHAWNYTKVCKLEARPEKPGGRGCRNEAKVTQSETQLCWAMTELWGTRQIQTEAAAQASCPKLSWFVRLGRNLHFSQISLALVKSAAHQDMTFLVFLLDLHKEFLGIA